MKRLSVIALFIVAIFILAGCQEGMISSSVNITSREGAGTKTIYVDIYKDSAKSPSYDGTVDNNSKFMPAGVTGVADKIKSSCKLSGVTVKTDDKGDFERISISYSFTSIADYNAKMKKLADGKAEILDAKLTVSGDKVTFTEPAENAYNSVLWALQAVYNDSAVFDKTGAGDNANNPTTLEQMANFYDMKITVNGTSKTVNLKEMPQTTELSVTGTIKALASTESKSDDKNPGTSASVPFSLLTLAAAAVVAAAYTLRKRAVKAS